MFDADTGLERIGIWVTLLGFLAGVVEATRRFIRWLFRLAKEHEMLMVRYDEGGRLIPRFLATEAVVEEIRHQQEQQLTELRGLRAEIHELVKVLLRQERE